MPYLVDANNLAGRLKLLREPDFDQTLIELIKDYRASTGKKFILVFDSPDPLGDRYTEGDVTVIYTPRDAVYSNADDKIMELMANEKQPQDWTVITDDMNIIEAARDLDIEIISTREFAVELSPAENLADDSEEDELSDLEQEEITDELTAEWKDD
ncbi:MAG: NYN domain-containing protein [Patescibacteria group bacterium]